MSRSARWNLVGLAGLAAFALLAGAVAADERSKSLTKGQIAYLDGVLAYNAGDYTRAVSLLTVAVASDGREGVQKFDVNPRTREDYFPNLYMGLALEKMGKKDEALAVLRESRKQGAVAARSSSNLLLLAALRRLEPAVVAESRESKPTAAPAPTAPPADPTKAPPTRAPAAPTSAAVAPTRAAAPTAVAALATKPPASPTPVSAEAASRAAVREGIRSYFKGEFAEAERLLANEAPRSPTARRFLAYTLGSRWLLAGKKDDGLRTRAKKEWAEAESAGPGSADTMVSPALKALFVN